MKDSVGVVGRITEGARLGRIIVEVSFDYWKRTGLIGIFQKQKDFNEVL